MIEVDTKMWYNGNDHFGSYNKGMIKYGISCGFWECDVGGDIGNTASDKGG